MENIDYTPNDSCNVCGFSFCVCNQELGGCPNCFLFNSSFYCSCETKTCDNCGTEWVNEDNIGHDVKCEHCEISED